LVKEEETAVYKVVKVLAAKAREALLAKKGIVRIESVQFFSAELDE